MISLKVKNFSKKKILFLSCVLASFCVSVQAKELTYANHLSPGHPVNVALKSYFKRVSKATGGTLNFKMFPGGQMGGGKAMLGMVRDGLVDASFVNGPYSPSDLPLESILGQLLHPNPLVLAATQNEMFLLHCPQCKEELTQNNVVPLMYYSAAAYYLMCTKPISTLHDAKGVKVRSAGAFGRLAAEIGMTPVNMTSDETYQALQRNQVSCVLGSLDWLQSYSLQDVIKDITNLPMDGFGGLMQLGMNKGSWDSLSKADKKAMKQGLAQTVADIEFKYINGGDKALKNARSKHGAHLVKPGPDLKARVEKFNNDAPKKAIDAGKHKGIEHMPKMVHEYVKVMAKWEKIINKIGDNKQAYKEALNREIFSKLKK